MSSSTSYGCFGCVKFAHNQRTKQYIRWACAQGMFPGDRIPPTNWICTCSDDDEEFTNPIEDEVCWYDPLIPESAEFLGIVITDVRGIRSSSFTREVEDNVDGGSILQSPTIRGKELVFEATIIATSCDGMDYGLEWMRRLFEDEARCPKDGTSCASCQGQNLTLRIHCPKEESTDRGLRTYPSAGTIDGIDFIEDDFPMGRLNCCTMRRMTWTVQTEDAASYSTEPVSDCTLTADDLGVFQTLGLCGSAAEPEFPCCPICGDTCDSCTTDPGCDCFPPYVLEPVTVGGVAPCFTDPVCRCMGAIGLSQIPSGYEGAMRLTLFAGWNPSDPVFSKFGMRNVVIRVFENRQELPIPTDQASYDAFLSNYLPCKEIGISWAPAGSQLVIDGLSQRSWLKCDGRCVDHSNRVFSIGGRVFPLRVRCVPLVVTVEWDCLNVQTDATLPNIPSSVQLETFLRHRT